MTASDKLKCAERECKQRARVYPRLVERGSMTPAQAAREIALMMAIAADYRKQVEGERLI